MFREVLPTEVMQGPRSQASWGILNSVPSPRWDRLRHPSLKHRLSVLNFVLQLWRKMYLHVVCVCVCVCVRAHFSPKLQDEILNRKSAFDAEDIQK